MNEISAVAERLRQLRKMKDITVSTVSETLDIAPRAYSSYERGERKPDLDTLSRIAEFYGVKVDYLIGRDPDDSDQTDQADNLMKRLSERDRRTVVLYASLPDEMRRIISDMVVYVSANLIRDM